MMASLSAMVALAALAGSGSAQRLPSGEHIWSSVGWILHGERTPYYSKNPDNPPSLTTMGAQQMFSQGSMLRARYLDDGTSDQPDKEAGIDRESIVGIQKNAIYNSQIDIISTTDSFIFGSALAFMQGLYPPIEQAFGKSSGTIDGAIIANGSLVNFPLGGYQYPNIKTSSVFDPADIWTEGHVGCTKYTESLLNLRNDEDVASIYNDSLDFYHSMWQQVFKDVIPQSMANYYNAYALYDYARYKFNHDDDNSTSITRSTLNTLEVLASSEQRSRNANLTASGTTEGDMIRAIAGRTMAAKVLAWFTENVRTQGSSNKLSLAFTAIEPFVAFFSLSKLTKGPGKETFLTLPSPGAAMVFELFSVGGNTSEYPSMDELWVRFLYRNGTDPDADLIQYPLFGNGNSQDSMRFSDFIRAIQNIDVGGESEWCSMCDSFTIYCLGLMSNSNGGGAAGGSPTGSNGGRRPSKGISPAVAGVIGAVVTASVLSMALLALAFFGCLGFRRNGSDAAHRNSSLGGFRGAEKMASDADLSVAKGGSRHERTGSWELRGGSGETSVTTAAEEPVSPLSPVGASFQPSGLRNSTDNRPDDDAVSEMGHSPTKPREF